MTDEAWLVDDDGDLDEVVVPQVACFRLERMSPNQWWIGLTLFDGRVIHIDLVADRRGMLTAIKCVDTARGRA